LRRIEWVKSVRFELFYDRSKVVFWRPATDQTNADNKFSTKNNIKNNNNNNNNNNKILLIKLHRIIIELNIETYNIHFFQQRIILQQE
jgi:hypothetical protein